MILTVTLLTSCVKLLLIPSYRSTDFEVHRNWLAVTHSLPVDRWYYDETSEWTLDYPPFFGWFEYLLSFVAAYFDENMLKVHNIGYSSEMTVFFQRLSVIVSDFVYFYGVHKICECLPKGWKKEVVLPILLITNCGLMMVDHIHFQYNGIMYGIMLLSIAAMWKENYKWAAFWFSFLLNLKHIYVYLAPAYFIYLLKHYCFNKSSQTKSLISKIQLNHFLGLGAIVIGVFAVSFAPFVYHIPQIISRLFPFKRGLCHAYWAPNVWAIYNTFDKGLFLILPRFGIEFSQNNSTLSITRGLVQEFTHSVLPMIRPSTTMALTITFIVPLMGKLFVLKKDPLNFLRCLVLSGLTSFLFGWHVHEKAILMIIIPLCILSVLNQRDAKIFLMMATIGHYSLFPLLFPVSLIFVKILLLILYMSYAFYVEYKIHLASACRYSLPLLNTVESLYLLGLTLVFFYENVIHKLSGLDSKLPFLPLMLTSFYCSLGVVYCWASYYFQLLHG